MIGRTNANSNLTGKTCFQFWIKSITTVNMVRDIFPVGLDGNKISDTFLMNTTYTTEYYRINNYSYPNATLTTLVDMKDENGNIVPANTTYTWTYSNGVFNTDIVTLVPIT